jgi:NADPH-dependent 2,4-dienoyl-CoA reductase/sulfur reductase-like enzyme
MVNENSSSMTNPERLLIIGGSDAGLSAALRARELDPDVRPMMVLADEYPNFSICGIPFYLSREVPDYWHLAHRTRAEIEALGIDVRTSTKAIALDAKKRVCQLRGPDGTIQSIRYEKLIVGTGARSIRPTIQGLDLPGVFTLRWMDEARAVDRYIGEHRVRNVLLIGAGYINLELADGLTKRRLNVTLVERNQAVLKTVDLQLGKVVGEQLEAHGVMVLCGQRAAEISRRESGFIVRLESGKELSAELVIVATGARPETTLAHSAGAELGAGGAIRVNQRMETNLEHVYAAGDCAETYHRIVEQNSYLPLGSTSHKQGRVAGENAIGCSREFLGTVGTQVVKVFDLIAVRTGLKDEDSRSFGFEPLTISGEYWDHKIYYPGAKKISLRLTGDKRTGRFLGLQMVGEQETLVAKRIDTAAAALFAHLTVDQLNDLDLSYSPPLNSPWDPLQTAAQMWLQGAARTARLAKV